MHFGVLQCRVSNTYGAQVFNMSLTEGLSEIQERILRYKLTVVVVASVIGLLLVFGLVWYRLGRFMYLFCLHRTSSREEHQYDVFLVHGESVSPWVYSVLLPTLEGSFGYNCFLPERDLRGGEMMADSIMEALTRCRRVVVMMTPCLMDSPWATWATYSGIKTALTSKARILALIPKESLMSGSLEHSPLMNVLRVVRKLRLPEDVCHELDGSRLQESVCFTSKENLHNIEVTLTLPDKMCNVSSTSIPTTQRLSYMVSDSKASSIEQLEGKENGVSVVCFNENTGHHDPGSPSSITPFIFSSHQESSRSPDDSVSWSFIWWFQFLCFGNPEERFWQTLRLYIGPPLLNTRETGDE